MKVTQKVTRVQLKVNQNIEFLLLGIVSAEPDYKLSLTLNKVFKISLKNISPVGFTDSKGSELEFSRFSDSSESTDIIFNLISNRSGKNYLLKSLKNVDYIFQVQDPYHKDNYSRFASILREIESVTAVFNIDINLAKEKNIQYLIQ